MSCFIAKVGRFRQTKCALLFASYTKQYNIDYQYIINYNLLFLTFNEFQNLRRQNNMFR